MKLESFFNNKGRDLTQGSLVKNILIYTLPLMVTGILQLMFNAADLIVVGQFAPNGQIDIGAIGGTAPLINLVITVPLNFILNKILAFKDNRNTFKEAFSHLKHVFSSRKKETEAKDKNAIPK